MAVRWRGREAGLEAAAEVAAASEFQLPWARPPLPHFPLPDGGTDA
jgi:hypothetical protein